VSKLKNILITGANGYIGSRLSLFLAEKGHRIYAVCYPKIPTDKNWTTKMFKIFVGDVSEPQFIQSLAAEKIDTIIHLVSLDHTESEKNNEFAFKVNVNPLTLLLEIFKDSLVNRVLYFSTMQVYGKNLNNIVVEEQLPSPVNIYGLTHFICETVMNYYHSPAFKCINLRLSNSYGSPIFSNKNCWNLVINDLCKMAFKNREIKLLSDGTPLRDFIHHTDVCKAVETLLFSETEENTFNVSNGKTYSILELSKFVQKVYADRYNSNIPIFLNNGQKVKERSSQNLLYRYTVDNTKLKKENFDIETNLTKGINELFDFLEDNTKHQDRD